MKRFLLLFLVIYMFTLPAFAQLEINLSSMNKNKTLLSAEYPIVYKPSRLIIGEGNIFKIKADSGSNVLLLVSSTNTGAGPLYGQSLRLGSDYITAKGIVPENGLLELKFDIPKNKTLEGKFAYFEVAVWKNENYKDLRLAKIMGDNCRETSSNEIVFSLPPQDVSKPSLAPMMPMMPPGFAKAIETVENNKNNKNKVNEDYSQYMYDNMYQTPAYIRNLHAPELMNAPK